MIPTPPPRDDGEALRSSTRSATTPERREEFEARAAAGNAHVLYALSPGGAVATAERVARCARRSRRPRRRPTSTPDLLEALVFLESAGRPDAMRRGHRGRGRAHPDPGRDRPEPARHAGRRRASRRYTRRIGARCAAGCAGAAPAGARGAGRPALRPGQGARRHRPLPEIAEERFGCEELAFVTYHMGIGNLESVLRAYGAEPGDEHAPTPQVYFDSSPLSHAAAQRKLAALGDDSSNYLWKLRAAREIMRLHREDPASSPARRPRRRAKNSAEEVLHPPGTTTRFTTPARCAGLDGEDVVALPDDPRATGLRIDPRMGELARRLAAASLYRGPAARGAGDGALHRRPGARDLGGQAPLTVTSTVRDQRYQGRLVKPQPRGDAQLLAAHDRLGVRRPAPLPLRAPGAGLPVRARPPALAEPDRLGVRAGGDPHHRLARTRRPCSRCWRGYNARDGRHPHAGRGARGASRTSRSSRTTARSTACGSRTSTRATARPW